MRNLTWVFVFALALSPMAMAADIAFYIGPFNPGWYGDEQFGDVDTIIAQTGQLFKDVQQFDDNQLNEFGAWLDENTNDGEMDIIWLNGTMPSVLYQFPNVDPDGSRAEGWLDGGNMIINVGDWFAYMSYEGGTRSADNAATGAANILDLPAGVRDLRNGGRRTGTEGGRVRHRADGLRRYTDGRADHRRGDEPSQNDRAADRRRRCDFVAVVTALGLLAGADRGCRCRGGGVRLGDLETRQERLISSTSLRVRSNRRTSRWSGRIRATWSRGDRGERCGDSRKPGRHRGARSQAAARG